MTENTEVRNKRYVFEMVYQKTWLTRKQCRDAMEAFFDTIYEALIKGMSVRTDLGTFVTAESREHAGRNPATGLPIVVPARKFPRLKFAIDVIEVVNGDRTHFNN